MWINRKPHFIDQYDRKGRIFSDVRLLTSGILRIPFGKCVKFLWVIISKHFLLKILEKMWEDFPFVGIFRKPGIIIRVASFAKFREMQKMILRKMFREKLMRNFAKLKRPILVQFGSELGLFWVILDVHLYYIIANLHTINSNSSVIGFIEF